MNRSLRRTWLALIALAACGGERAAGTPSVGAPAPAFAVKDLDGKPVSLADLRGKVVVLNEWATWCEPCRAELPRFEALYRQYAGQGLVLVGVSVDAFGMGGDVRDFAREHDMTYPIWLDPDKTFAVKFLTIGVPETFLVDRAGVIRWRQIGALRDGDTTFVSAVQRVLKS